MSLRISVKNAVGIEENECLVTGATFERNNMLQEE
jgi:hypothetical protein